MSKVFGKQSTPNPKVKRNTYDLSFDNNLSLNFGGLYPVMCKEVLPGDSFRIKTSFGLRFLPLAFPVQTKMRADVHFFYVRDRNLWEDFMDFIGNTQPKSAPPFIDPYRTLTPDFLKTGSLADYLGVPTTWSGRRLSTTGTVSLLVDTSSVDPTCSSNDIPGSKEFGPIWSALQSITLSDGTVVSDFLDLSEKLSENPSLTGSPINASSFVCNYQLTSEEYISNITFKGFDLVAGTYHFKVPLFQYVNISSFSCFFTYSAPSGFGFFPVSGSVKNGVLEFDLTVSDTHRFLGIMFPTNGSYYKTTSVACEYTPVGFESGVPVELIGRLPNGREAENPFTNKVPLSALPFRAYESIYNSFYRDDRNNPYFLDGKLEYNKYIPSTAGGSDNYNYQLRYRNWEQDFLTTAVPSPQQGNAPLVGITSTGTATFVASEDNKEYNVNLTATDGNHVDGVSYTENIPNSVQRSLLDVVTSGISINDFRNVNAFQRWLETNMRKGLKYRDQVASHYGVDISYQELDMPEFLGGVSQIVSVQQIDQTSSSVNGSPLGSYAGQAYAVGQSKHAINRYFDEHGFVIAILSVSPVPIYSQLLPKFFTKTDVLDYYFPEFGHIGFQPVSYREVCPIEAVNSDVDVDSTFGYQRAWYDYLGSVDEAHGLMRTDFRDFLISRFYGAVPRLTPDFLELRPEQTNNIFMDTDVSDKILGRVIFDITAKRPIPRYGIPRLE